MGSAGRRTTPLFDLVPEKSGASAKLAAAADAASNAARGKPVIRVELEPSPAVEAEAAPQSRTPRASAEESRSPVGTMERTWAPDWLGGSLVRVPINAVSIGVAVGIILVLVAWIFGVATGQSRAERDLARFDRQTPNITDPLVEGTDSGLNGGSANQPLDRPKTQVSKNPGTSKAAVGQTLTSKGTLDGDPREAGLNYLALAVLSAEDAASAIEFLSQNGLEAFGVPVDSGASKANNPIPAGTYRLFAFPGVSSDEYKRRATKVTNLEAEAARLGSVWQKQHRGTSNFSRTQWEKYKE